MSKIQGFRRSAFGFLVKGVANVQEVVHPKATSHYESNSEDGEGILVSDATWDDLVKGIMSHL